MKTLRKYVVNGGLFAGDGKTPATVGNQVRLYLDTEAHEDFPEFIVGTIQHPVAPMHAGTAVSYSFEYNEGDLLGVVANLIVADVISVSVTSVIEDLDALTAAVATKQPLDSDLTAYANAADAAARRALIGAAPLVSPTFTGPVTASSFSGSGSGLAGIPASAVTGTASTLAGTETLSNKTLAGYTEAVTTLTYASTLTLSIATATVQEVILTGNCSFTAPTPTPGKSFTLHAVQDGTGGRVITFAGSPSITWLGGTTPTWDVAANARNIISFTAKPDGSGWIGSLAGAGVAADTTITDGSTNAVSGNAVFDALALKAPLVSPSFTTPSLGVASATTVNGVAITPKTSATLNLAEGESFSTAGEFATGGYFTTGGNFYTAGNFAIGNNFSTNGSFRTGGTFYTGDSFITGGTFSTSSGFATTGASDVTFAMPSNGERIYTFPTSDGTLALTTDITAATTAFTPAGSLSATNVQAALVELDATTGEILTTLAETPPIRVNVKSAPYYAAGVSTGTTTVGSTASGATSVTVASPTSFVAGNGINITGAGVGGIAYIGKITAVVGSILTVTPATSTTVSNGAVVRHDDTVAIQTALNSLIGVGGVVFMPAGTYLVNGPLQEPGVIDAKIVIPINTYDDRLFPVGFTIEGESAPTPGSREEKGRQTLIVTEGTSGTIFDSRSGYGEELAGGTYIADCTLNWAYFKNLAFRAPLNPLIGFTGGRFAGMFCENIMMDTGMQPAAGYFGTTTFAKPTNNVTAIKCPPVSNAARVILRNIACFGFGTAIHAGEHTDMANIYIAKGITGILCATHGHGIYGARIQVEHCTDVIKSSGPVSSLMISNLGTENISGYLVNDAANDIKGIINYSMQGQGLAVNGATGVRLENLRSPGGASGDFGNVVARSSTLPQVKVDNFGETSSAVAFFINGVYKGDISYNNVTGQMVFYCLASMKQDAGLVYEIVASGYTRLIANALGIILPGGARSLTGYTFGVVSGSNALAGTITLVAGTATITSTAITNSMVIVLSIKTVGGTPGTTTPKVVVAAGSAVVTGLSTDTSTYNWLALSVL